MRTLTDGTTGALNRLLASGVSYNISYDTRPDGKKQMRQTYEKQGCLTLVARFLIDRVGST